MCLNFEDDRCFGIVLEIFSFCPWLHFFNRKLSPDGGMLRETINQACIHSRDQQKKGSSQMNDQGEEIILADSERELQCGRPFSGGGQLRPSAKEIEIFMISVMIAC
jgi:hypothetical protein